MSDEKTFHFPLYWMFNRDRYDALFQCQHKWVVFHPHNKKNQTTRGLFFIAQMSNKKPLEVFIPEIFHMEWVMF